MTNLDYKEKILGVIDTQSRRNIAVTHVTIRQSIFFLTLRILVIEIIAAVFVILIHIVLSNQTVERIGENISLFNIPIFLFLVFVKTFLVIFVIVQWLNEYYEVTTDEVIYRRGLVVKREDRHKLNHIGSVDLEQSFLGKIFNYGTLKMFVWTTEKEVLLYLIHNPIKYQRILEELLPDVEKSKKVFREHLLEPEENKL